MLDSLCVTTRIIAKSLFEIARVGIKAGGGWAGGGAGVGMDEGPNFENVVLLSIIPNGWPALSTSDSDRLPASLPLHVLFVHF